MTADELKAIQKQQPFKPFRIVLDDGKAYDIPHPNFVWVLPHTVHVGTRGDIVEGFWDRRERFALDRVKSVEFLSQAPVPAAWSGS